ncbi:floral homeotic protein APETALA 1-like [Telopea speciosissima]|uniref:floral homeotic protein APETALA 1-like n=1 Tax=Telopea speciosissima TaxID=54955 RepID=UPI001CC63EE6|nr:floral homeotic protein APETALA 1-like [Telopea speciosissima]
MGKRKIDIELLENEKKKNVTFSKRRKGLFHKASELGNLCNVQTAIVVFSPAGNPFTFTSHGSPADIVIQRYLEKYEPADIVKEDGGFWWDTVDVNKYCSMEDFLSLKSRLERLKENICCRLTNMTVSFSSHEMGNIFEDLPNCCNKLPVLSSSSSSYQEMDDIFEALPEVEENICGQHELSSSFSDQDLSDFFSDLPDFCV